MSAHTPGPWKYYSGTHSIYGANERAVCVVTGARKLPDRAREANARLIAAAPTLLAALETFLDLCPRMSDNDPIAPALADACRDARAVIAKAKESA